MNPPLVPQKSPYPLAVEAGKTYYWCACGRSQNQPLCDGSHQGTGLEPKPHVADKSGTVYFCGCKHSRTGALCDGSHKAL